MPVRQATPTAVRGRKEDRAAEEPKKPRQGEPRGKDTSPLAAPASPPQNEHDLPVLVQSLFDLSEPEPLVTSSGSIGTLASEFTPSEAALLSPLLTASPAATTALTPLAEDVQEEESIPLSPGVVAIANDAAPEGGVAIRPNGKGSHSAADGDIDYHHDSEAEFGRLLDYYGIEWQYEPHQFPLEWRDGRPIVMFTPDFYLPEYDLYIELTTMRQSLVRRKNRKLRLLRAFYPEINIKLLYRRDYHRLLQRFGIAPEELDAEAAQSLALTARLETHDSVESST